MDVSIQGNRDAKNLPFDVLNTRKTAVNDQLSKTFYHGNENGIKCYHENKEMKWAKSRL